MPAKHNPSEYQRKLVRRYIAAGTTREGVAKIIGISLPTLRARYEDELATATDKANGLVAGALFSNAMKGNVTAQIFWLKTRARWSESADSLPEGMEAITVATIRRVDGSINKRKPSAG